MINSMNEYIVTCSCSMMVMLVVKCECKLVEIVCQLIIHWFVDEFQYLTFINVI